MKKKFLAALTALTVSSFAPAYAATVVIGADGMSASYRNNGDIGITRPIPQKLKGTAVKDGNAYIPKGAQFDLMLTRAVNGTEVKVGDKIDFALTEDFFVNESKVIPKETQITGTVMAAHKKNILITVDEMKAANNVPIAIKCRVNEEVRKGSVYLAKGHKFSAVVTEDTDLMLTMSQLENFGIYYGMEEIARHL